VSDAGVQGGEDVRQVAPHSAQNHLPQPDGHSESVRAFFGLHPPEQPALRLCLPLGRRNLSSNTQFKNAFVEPVFSIQDGFGTVFKLGLFAIVWRPYIRNFSPKFPKLREYWDILKKTFS